MLLWRFVSISKTTLSPTPSNSHSHPWSSPSYLSLGSHINYIRILRKVHMIFLLLLVHSISFFLKIEKKIHRLIHNAFVNTPSRLLLIFYLDQIPDSTPTAPFIFGIHLRVYILIFCEVYGLSGDYPRSFYSKSQNIYFNNKKYCKSSGPRYLQNPSAFPI